MLLKYKLLSHLQKNSPPIPWYLIFILSRDSLLAGKEKVTNSNYPLSGSMTERYPFHLYMSLQLLNLCSSNFESGREYRTSARGTAFTSADPFST